jgi:heat shock protein HslJ
MEQQVLARSVADGTWQVTGGKSHENNQIVVDMVQAGPDDPLCCPSQHVINTYELQGNQLVETSSQVVEDGPKLVGTPWYWDQTTMNNGEMLVPDNPASYTVQFFPDSSILIQADCNQVIGTYTVEGSSITIQMGPVILAACPPGSLSDQFVANLNEAAIYTIQDDKLLIGLRMDSGTMQFAAPLSTDLAGTSWVVTGYNNGTQAVVSPIIGTELTATFGEDGNLTGSAGCNDYSASYQVDGNNISIGPVIATLKECGTPAGIMEQELQYLAALETAATYKIQGNFLEMRTAEGSLAVTFQTAPS